MTLCQGVTGTQNNTAGEGAGDRAGQGWWAHRADLAEDGARERGRRVPENLEGHRPRERGGQKARLGGDARSAPGRGMKGNSGLRYMTGLL